MLCCVILRYVMLCYVMLCLCHLLAGGATVGSGTDQLGTSEGLSEKADSRRSAILQKFSPKLIKNILELLCDESVCIVYSPNWSTVMTRTFH